MTSSVGFDRVQHLVRVPVTLGGEGTGSFTFDVAGARLVLSPRVAPAG